MNRKGSYKEKVTIPLGEGRLLNTLAFFVISEDNIGGYICDSSHKCTARVPPKKFEKDLQNNWLKEKIVKGY